MRAPQLRISVWLLVAANALMAEPAPLQTLQVPVESRIVAVSPNFQFVAVSLGLELVVIDIPSAKCLFKGSSGRAFGEPGMLQSAVAFTPDSRELLVAHEDGFLEALSLQTGTRSAYQPLSHEGLQTLNLAADPSTGNTLVFVTTASGFSLWRYPAFQVVHTFSVQPTKTRRRGNRFVSAIHPSGSLAAVGDKDRREVRLFNLDSGDEIFGDATRPFVEFLDEDAHASRVHLPSHHHVISLIKFRDTDYTRGDPQWIEVDIYSGSHRNMGYFPSPEAAPFHAFSGNGRRLAVGDFNYRCASLFSSHSFQTWVLKEHHHIQGTSVALSEDGHQGLTLAAGTLELWSLP